MAKKLKKPFTKKVLRMKKNHNWEAPSGYKIVVADRGAVSYNVPTDWHMAQLEPLEFNDKEPPDDNTRLSMSFWRLPPEVDWTGLPLAGLLADATKGSELEILARSEIITVPRTDIELMWTEHRFLDPVEKREAYTRIATGRGFNVQVLITMDFWVEDSEKVLPVWAEVMRSLQLGRYIEDPTVGIVRH